MKLLKPRKRFSRTHSYSATPIIYRGEVQDHRCNVRGHERSGKILVRGRTRQRIIFPGYILKDCNNFLIITQMKNSLHDFRPWPDENHRRGMMAHRRI